MNNSFLSIVDPTRQKEGKPRVKGEKLLVRGRFKGDIEKVFPEAIVIPSPTRDYAFRAYVARDRVARVLAEQVRNIDYHNFKDSIPKADHWRHMLYLDVWVAMANEQWNRLVNRFTPYSGKYRSAFGPVVEDEASNDSTN